MGTENLTYYVVPMNITGQIHGFSSSLLLMIFPLASELGATMETERLLSIYKRVSKYIFALVTFIVLSLCVSGHEFFRLWLSLDFADKTYKIVAIQAVTFGIIAVGIVTWQMMEGLGFTNRNAVLTVLWVAVSITAMIILSPILKLEGVGIGRLLGCVLMLIYILIVEKWVFGKPLWSFWLQIGFSLSIAAGFAALLEYAWLKNFSFGWLGFLIGIGFGGIGYLTGLIATRFLNVEERRSLQNTFFRFLPQFSENK
jgi:O-antigen/teichoic acid export membrane protein